MPTAIYEAAQELAARRAVIHPLTGKRPGIAGWQNRDKPPTPDEVRKWWGSNGLAAPGIGLLTGAVNDCVCLDVDVKGNGPENLMRLEAAFGEVPKTRCEHTPSGGYHYFFRYPNRGICTIRRPDLGLELLSDRSQVALHPTPGYEVITGGPLAELPEWLVDNLGATPQTDARENTGTWRTDDRDPWDYVPLLCGESDSSGRFHCPAPGHADRTPSLAIYTDSDGRGFCSRPEQGGTHFHCHACQITGRERELAALALGIYEAQRRLGVVGQQRLDSTARRKADEYLRTLGFGEGL